MPSSPCTCAPLFRSAYTRAAANDLVQRLTADRGLPTALIAATDEQAIGVLAAAYAADLHVPDRLAVISLDGTTDSAHTCPALTVTEQPMQAIAQRAVELLLDGNPPGPAHARLVPRRSCGCSVR